ncbi:AMP-dependent synthetase and ligase [Ferroglobus placidus DSM 10642]|uniref:AMP-dependent synthetase and ligase n=1 Tax=Ferroglobus placidus (strain DSM 10642 / AEDII12DO) TaxID=589924 RepID=D3S021_FERPA|nr:phenylacetate--CoA ligase [Ferroglobus placidus]ADC66084.1 AMP-dependent synthetase and ligase [Ferroglobus placidus DSM 10642]
MPLDNYWQKEEIMPRRELEELQLKRLKWVVNHAYRNVAFYKRRLKELGVHPSDIKKLEDVKKLPFTTKEDFASNYPFGLFAVPLSEVVRIHTSSGTTGKPKVVGYTRNDLENWTNLVARCLYMVGVRKDDVFQNMVNYSLFTGGLGFHYAAERIGATTIPAGVGNTRRQLELMMDLGTTAIHCTPSYALRIKEVSEEWGLNFEGSRLRIGCFGAEPWSENLRKRLEEFFGIKAFDSYGLSEMNGPGVAFECEEQNGLHIWIDHYLVEIVDEEGNPVGEGEKGELVLTALTKEAMPILRYRTGDITFLIDEKCSCGRTHPKIARISGRVDDMVVVKGVNVYPSQVEHSLMKIPEVCGEFQIVVDRKTLDNVTVRVEVPEDKVNSEKLKAKIEEILKSDLGVRVNVELVKKGELERTGGKAKRVVDLRKNS